MSTQTAKPELKYKKLLEKHNLKEESLPPNLKTTLGLLKSNLTRYEKKPSDAFLVPIEKYDNLLVNGIQDLVEDKLPAEPTVPEPPAAAKPEPTPSAEPPAPEPTPAPAAKAEPEPPAAPPAPEPPPTKSDEEKHEEAVLDIINSNPEKCIRDHEIEKIIGRYPDDPLQKVGATTLRRQLHGKYYIYK